jgi:hypothetical protein
MEIEEEKPGGGSGGDLPDLPAPPDPTAVHADEKQIQGPFGRAAFGKVALSALPDDQGESWNAILAHGENGKVNVQGQKMVYIVGGALEGYQPGEAKGAGVMVICLDNRVDTIRLQLGYLEDPACLSIGIQHNGIVIDSGTSGFIHLHSGPAGAGSSIHLAPEGITMKGTQININ